MVAAYQQKQKADFIWDTLTSALQNEEISYLYGHVQGELGAKGVAMDDALVIQALVRLAESSLETDFPKDMADALFTIMGKVIGTTIWAEMQPCLQQEDTLTHDVLSSVLAEHDIALDPILLAPIAQVVVSRAVLEDKKQTAPREMTLTSRAESLLADCYLQQLTHNNPTAKDDMILRNTVRGNAEHYRRQACL